jgi:hypothetical protein
VCEHVFELRGFLTDDKVSVHDVRTGGSIQNYYTGRWGNYVVTGFTIDIDTNMLNLFGLCVAFTEERI